MDRGVVMGESEPDWYAVLGAGASSSQVEIRRLHRQAVKQQHPDRTQHLPASRRAALEADFIEVTAAWAVLGDPVARAAYDLRRAGREARRDAQRAAAREATQRRRDETRASRPTPAGGQAAAPRVPTQGGAGRPVPPAGEDHHEHLAVPAEQLRRGVTVTDSRTGATYGPFHQVGVFRIRSHGQPSIGGGPRGHLILHVTVQDHAAETTTPAERGGWRRRGAAMGWRTLAATGGLIWVAQELLLRR